MEDKDYIKDLFSQKLGNYEAKVNPQLWDKIASQVSVGATAASTATGVSLLTKWMIGLGVSAVVATSVVLIANNQKEEAPKDKREVSQTNTVTERQEIVQDATEMHSEINQASTESETTPHSSQVNAGINQRRSTPMEVLQLPVNGLLERDHLVDEMSIVDPKVTEPAPNPEVDPGVNSTPPPSVVDPTINEPSVPELDYWIEKLPNVFSPNNDGANDELFINSKGLLDFNMVVLDNNSQVIYSSNDPNFRWNGMTRSGETVTLGNYVYFITAKDSKGNTIREFSKLSVTK